MDIHANNKLKFTSYDKLAITTFVILLTITLMAGVVNINTNVSADDSRNYTAGVAVNVSSSCTMERSVDIDHTATITPTQYTDDIGTTSITVTCNDPDGYAVYAIGYGNNTWNNNKLTSNDSNVNETINTADRASTTDSHWYMKLFAPADGVTIHNSYDNYKAVPGGDDTSDNPNSNGYIKVASYGASTGTPNTTSFKTTYGAYASANQIAGSYTGQVKYTLVNPHMSDDSNKPETKYFMQDIANWKDEKLANIGDTVQVVDRRDGETYTVARLKDNNIWMLDNLRLGSNEKSVELTPKDTNIVSEFTLPQGITSGFTNPASAQINAAYKNDIVTSYGGSDSKVGVYYNYCAASAGAYCKPVSSNDVDIPDTLQDATYDICPAGWRLPTGSVDGEYQSLFNQYDNSDPTDTNSVQYNLAVPLSGNFYGDTQFNLNKNAYYWTSTYYDVSRMYSVRISSVLSTGSVYYYNREGYTVRCLAQ